MTTGRGFSWREAISALGVVLSLLFVGWELRQANAMARLEANADTGGRWMEWNLTVAADAGLSELVARVLDDDLTSEDLTPGEGMQMYLVYEAALRGWETGYLNALAIGTDLGEYRFIRSRLFSGAYSRDVWPRMRASIDPRFAAAFEAFYEIEAEPGA